MWVLKTKKDFFRGLNPTCSMSYVALLAGEGMLPQRVLEGMKKEGHKVLLLAVKGDTDPSLLQSADSFSWLYPTQLGKAIKLCQKWGVQEIVFAGRVHHKKIYNLPWLRADWQSIKLWLSFKDRRADTMLKGVCDLFGKKGIAVAPLKKYLGPYIVRQDVPSRQLTPQEKEDVLLGVRMAKELGRLDIGQTVAVKKGAIVAVEAMEGTDACIERAALLAGRDLVIVKMAKPHQDERFDLPVIGRNTIDKLIKVKAKVLALQGGSTIVVDPEVYAIIAQHSIALVLLEEA